MSARKLAKFAGTKPLATIKAQCKAAGVEFDDHLYRERGDDHIALRSPGAIVLFNSFNGRFFGNAPDGTRFSSDDRRDGEPWFDALPRFFYIAKAGGAT